MKKQFCDNCNTRMASLGVLRSSSFIQNTEYKIHTTTITACAVHR